MRRFSTVSGRIVRSEGRWAACGVSSTTRVPAVSLRAARGRGLGRAAQTVRREVGRVGEPGRLAPHDADPGAAFPPRHELLGAAVVEAGARGAPVLDEHLGEVAAVAQRVLERRTEHIGFEHGDP